MNCEIKKLNLSQFNPILLTALLALAVLFSACANPEAKRRKAGEQLQARMMEIDKQFAQGLISQDEKDRLELEAIETHRLRWNKIGDVPEYPAVNNYQMQGGGAAQNYRQY